MVMVGVSWMCSAMGYIISLAVNPANATLTATIVSIVLGAFFSGVLTKLAVGT
jgi:hypothetical protein